MPRAKKMKRNTLRNGYHIDINGKDYYIGRPGSKYEKAAEQAMKDAGLKKVKMMDWDAKNGSWEDPGLFFYDN